MCQTSYFGGRFLVNVSPCAAQSLIHFQAIHLKVLKVSLALKIKIEYYYIEKMATITPGGQTQT